MQTRTCLYLYSLLSTHTKFHYAIQNYSLPQPCEIHSFLKIYLLNCIRLLLEICTNRPILLLRYHPNWSCHLGNFELPKKAENSRLQSFSREVMLVADTVELQCSSFRTAGDWTIASELLGKKALGIVCFKKLFFSTKRLHCVSVFCCVQEQIVTHSL